VNQEPNTDRLQAFSDGVFAVIITVLVLEFHPPHEASWSSLLAVWPTAISYAVSYGFIAIVWVNHHHLLRFAETATGRLIWGNFAHLFSVSLVPFTTEWMASTHLAGVPVCVYALVFVLVNATYIALCMETVDRPRNQELPPRIRATMRMRSASTLVIFAAAAALALWYPLAGFALVVLCLLLYLRPDVIGPALPGAATSGRNR
jgi:uncharacterized membrane protein